MKLYKNLGTLLGAAALLASASLAQAQQSSVELVQVEDGDRQVEAFGITVDDLEGMSVVDPNNESVGDVGAVLMDEGGDIQAVSVDVGGFLGMGARNAIVELDSLNYDQEQEQLQLDMTQEEIEQLPTMGE